MRDGFYPVNQKENVSLDWHAAEIDGARSCQLQISPLDVSFSQLAGGFRECENGEQPSTIIGGLPVGGTRTLTRRRLWPGRQVRNTLAALDEKGAILGFYSDPVSLMVTDKPFGSKLEKAIFNLRAQRAR